jgi:hypothetical protein
LPHACERIDDGRVNFVKCKSHDFNHGLNSVGFHGKLKQALLNIQTIYLIIYWAQILFGSHQSQLGKPTLHYY